MSRIIITLRGTRGFVVERGRARCDQKHRQRGLYPKAFVKSFRIFCRATTGRVSSCMPTEPRHQIGVGLRLLAGNRRLVGVERHRAGRGRHEYRRPAVRRRDRQHSAVVDHRAEQTPDPRRGDRRGDQRHRRVFATLARTGGRDLSTGGENGRRGRLVRTIIVDSTVRRVPGAAT